MLTDLSAASLYIEGDLLLLAIIPIYNSGKEPMTCGDIRTAISVDISEGVRYAVHEFNSKKGRFADMFIDKTIGLVIINSCDNALLTQAKLLTLYDRGIRLKDGQIVSVKDRIIGVVGGLGAAVSKAVATVFGNLGFVQVSINVYVFHHLRTHQRDCLEL